MFLAFHDNEIAQTNEFAAKRRHPSESFKFDAQVFFCFFSTTNRCFLIYLLGFYRSSSIDINLK